MAAKTIAFVIGVLTFFGPAIIYFAEMGLGEEDDPSMITWLMSKDLRQIYALQGMIFSGVTLMTASMLLP